MKKYILLALVIIAGLTVVFIVSIPGSSDSALITTKSGLKYQDIKVGDGAEAKAGDNVVMDYTGWLTPDGKAKGKKFDSSVDRGKPFAFRLGVGKVIPGWDEGVAGMKVGGKRILIIPPELGYGPEAQGDDIPANSTLLFEVELIRIQQ